MLARIRLAAVILAAALAFGTSAVLAQEYCVQCSEPNAIYRCVIEGAKPGSLQPLQTQCVNAMTKAGNHANCAIKRGTVFDCDGPVRRVPWTASGDETPAPLATPRPEEKPPDDPKAPPKTVQEMTDRASKKAAEDMKKAGDVVKQGAKDLGQDITSGAKKTWECISSLFFKC